MRTIFIKVGKFLLIVLAVVVSIYIFFTLYELMDYFNIGADNS